MDPEFADLIPLFVAEARGRLERLAALCQRVERDAEAMTDARRELHTLKGAGRMLRLTPVAELCHVAEGALQAPRAGTGALLSRVVDQLTAMTEAAARGEILAAGAELLELVAGKPAAAPPEASLATVPSGSAAHAVALGEVRLEAAAVDAMADRATRLRILALGGEQFVVRLNELARLAEDASRSSEPRQALAVLAASLRRVGGDLGAGQKRLHRTAATQLDALLGLQVQPLRGFLHFLARHARELARSLGREVEVELHGEDTRLDRRITQELQEALLHLVRNAVDHGIEEPAAREVLGKPRAGRIRLEATAAGNRVRLAISDDGAGIDPVRVREAALAADLLDEAHATTLSRDDALRLVFSPGFSTRAEISELSGRGIGLDAVASAAARVGGSVAIDSQPGRGTTVTVEVPAARRGEEVVLIRVGGLRLALPAAVVRRVDRLPAAAVVEREGRPLAQLGERLVQFVPLDRLLGETVRGEQLLLQGEYGGTSLAIAVEAIEGTEEVLVRPVARALAANPLLDGVALLASGQPIGVLSAKAMAQGGVASYAAWPVARPAARKLKVLLVDDSLVTREMERRLLEESGFDVAAAGDAAEALARLAEEAFDCLVVDIEMPGMDGLELVRHLRAIPTFAHLPVAVVSTRDRPEDRLAGLDAGADAYLTKQGLDATELTAVIRRLGGR